MLCCVASVLTVAALPAWRAWLLNALGIYGIALAVAFSIPAVLHFNHYLARAEANDRALLAEILARPICTGAASPVTSASTEGPAHS